MNYKRGNTYKLYCKPDNLEDIEKLVFAINDTKKTYKSDGTGDIINDDGTLVISLSQADTLKLKNSSKCEVAVKLMNGDVMRSMIQSGGVFETIIEEAI